MTMQRRTLVGILCVLSGVAGAAEPPRLIVVVSVDQLCQDYLLRFRDNFSPEGVFRRVFEHGSHYSQCHHAHAFTVTAPGHSVQLTGAYPATSGVIGNSWFDRYSGIDVFCMADSDVQTLGTVSSRGVSPKNLLVETVGDVLRLKTAGRSKVFGVAVKERAAILMTGHHANAAYWLENNVWVTSSYYRPDLPGYVRHLNDGLTRDELAAGGSDKLHGQLQRAFHPRNSGDVLYVCAPYCVPGSKGTTHGSPWHYDTHVPLLLLGTGIAAGGPHHRPVSPACLASTIAELAGCDWPSANTEQPLREALAR